MIFKLPAEANVFMLSPVSSLTHIVCKDFKIDKLTTEHWTNTQCLLYFKSEILVSSAILYLVYGTSITDNKISS